MMVRSFHVHISLLPRQRNFLLKSPGGFVRIGCPRNRLAVNTKNIHTSHWLKVRCRSDSKEEWEKSPDYLGLPKSPNPFLTASEAVQIQLEALRTVHQPDGDLKLQKGLEILYSFALIDPFDKGSAYFGSNLNIAYFSQFSAKFGMKSHKILLGLDEYTILSCLHVSEKRYSERVLVRSGRESGVFRFNLCKTSGGHLHMCWLTETLVREEND